MPVENRVLAEFYESARGRMAQRLIGHRLRSQWPELAGRRLLGLGFATPYLRPYLSTAERVLAAQPCMGGAVKWPKNAPSLSVEVDEQTLPFPDAFFDCILLVHGLETAEAMRPFLREIWRVLTSDGRVLAVVPNRTSLWAQLESTPFGHGRPYSRGQLQRLFEEALFKIEVWDLALFVPPFGRMAPRSGRGWERLGRRLWPRLAGVHIVEVSKALYVPAPTQPALLRRLRPVHAGSI